MRGLFAIAAGIAVLLSCTDFKKGPYPVEGTTWRVEQPVPSDKGDVKIDVFANRVDCQNAREVDAADIPSCIPRIDRGAGQVEIGFRVIDKGSGNTLPLALNKQDVSVAHQRATVGDDSWEFIPHGPMRAGQLFVLVLDGSASIYQTGGIQKVQAALLTPAVMDAFLPQKTKGSKGPAAGVVLLRFSDNVQTIDGKDPLTAGQSMIIEDRDAYQQLVKNHLQDQTKAGFSFVYNAVTFSATKLLESPAVHQWMQINQASPTIVMLTDGFNDEKGADTCKDNVPKLDAALNILSRSRQGAGVFKPTIYTIGLGVAMQPNFKLPPGGHVTNEALCRNYGDQIINDNLENVGIDNPSLAWLADAGGGKSYVKNNHKGLADVFLEAAALRYKWFEIKYKEDSFFFRHAFTTRIRLNTLQGETNLTWHPSAWLDAPSGTVDDDHKWFEQASLRQAFVVVMGLLGVLVTLAFVGPAAFNARRALFRRARGKK